jgi:hypothetical protein
MEAHSSRGGTCCPAMEMERPREGSSGSPSRNRERHMIGSPAGTHHSMSTQISRQMTNEDIRRVIRMGRYSAKRISAEKRRNSGGPKTSVPKFSMGWSPPVPFDPLRSPWSHATCCMWCNAWTNQGLPMDHGYDIRVILVHRDRHHDS